jgi:putative transposase
VSKFRGPDHFPFLDKVYWGVEGIWSIGYFVSTVGISEEIIQKYIELQEREDSGQAQLEL